MTEETGSQVKVLDVLIGQLQSIEGQANQVYGTVARAEHDLSDLVGSLRDWRDKLQSTRRKLCEEEGETSIRLLISEHETLTPEARKRVKTVNGVKVLDTHV
jgi:hypothetical protein